MTSSTGSSLEHAIGPDGLVSLRLRDGQVRLRATDGETIRIHDSGDRDLSEMFAIELGDGSVSLRATRDPGILGRRRHGSSPDLEVEVPQRATIIVETASADIDAHGLLGDQRYRTASGDVKLQAVSGRIAIDAISGDVDVVANGTADVALRTVSGDVELRAGTLRSLRATSTSGDLKVAGRLEGPGPFSVETVSGDALVAPAGDVRIEMTTVSGDLDSEVGDRPTGSRGHRSLSVGAGGPLLTFRSMSGDLRVVRATPAGTPSTTARSALAMEPIAALASPKASPMASPKASPDPDPGMVAPEGPAAEADGEGRLSILRLLERGDIDVVEAGRLLAALDGGEPADPTTDTTRTDVAEPSDV
jgi:hypothetical protein